MSKIQINNEIILMRKNVEQAKVQTIKKLTRSALKLRQKKGTEAQKAKNVRKAERIAAEILAIKKTKKDEITKYILTNNLNLKEVLENQKSEPLTRIMARIAEHKQFSKKIAEFKTKYSNYMEFLGPGRKKAAKLERQKKRKLKAGKTTENVSSDADSDANTDSDPGISDQETAEAPEVLEKTEDSSEDDKSESKNEIDTTNEIVSSDIVENENEVLNEDEDLKKTDAVKDAVLPKSSKKRKSENGVIVESNTKNHSKPKKRKKDSTSKAVSKEAIVKRFTDLLNDDSSELDKDQLNNENKDSNGIETVTNKPKYNADEKSKKSILGKRKKIEQNLEEDTEKHKKMYADDVKPNVNIEKEVDPFFVTGDGESNYLSVALPKSKLVNMEDDSEDRYPPKFSKRKFSQKQNNSFFDKVPKRFKGDDNLKSNRSNFTRQDHQRNGRSYEKDKGGYKSDSNKFNSEPKDKSKSFKKQSKGNFEGNEVLHPSWEAKKKQQEILKKGFQGKKIIFDDV